MTLVHTIGRQFLRCAAWILILYWSGAAAQAAGSNVLLLIADDFGIDVASFYPLGPRRQTTPPPPPMPHLTALAQQGVIFTRVWASPWCSPTRAQILTGRHNFRTGIGRANTSDMPPLSAREVILPEVLGPAFLTANLGKWHLSSGEHDPNDHGWQHYAGGHPDLGHLPSYFSWPKTVDGVTSTSTVYATTDTADETLAMIARARAEGKRFLAWTAFNAPHDPFHVPPAGLHPTTPLPPTGATSRDKFAAMVEAMDTEIGRLLGAVSLADTTVIFIGDNGTVGTVIAPPYSRTKAKATMYEPGVRVPLLVAGAGVASPNRKVTQLVSAVDLFPTILALAGVDPARVPRSDGVSLMPYLRRQAHPSPRTWLYGEQFTKRFDTDWQRAARDSRYKLIERYDGSREFYDLSTDALETKNLLQGSLTSGQRSALDRLDRRIDALLATRGT
jgi:arylsulfatase A-like enzyme